MTGSGLDALQRTLAAEHAAVFVLAALGGRASALSSPPLLTAVTAAYDVHLGRRDRLRVMVVAAGGDPVASEPAYRLPARIRRAPASAAALRAQALRVERGCAATYAALVAATAGADRRWAVTALAETALAEAGFGGAAEALPGVGAAGR